MYDFVDTTESQSRVVLPAEALCMNGTYIENEIAGYRTLHVTGRELLESEVDDIQVGNADGMRYQGKRAPSRIITVAFQLEAGTPEQFRSKFNRLSQILEQEQAQLIFLDEPDKYFIGTKSEVGEAPKGALNITDEFSFYCSDPYKYAVTDKRGVNSGNRTLTLTNDGTVPVPINIKVTSPGDNGYLGFTLADRFYQVGNPGEVDGEHYERTEILFDDHLWKDKGWLLNNGITPPVTPERLQNGTVGYVKETASEGFVHTVGYGAGDWWHGASMTKTIPPDVNGKYPVNWWTAWRFDFNTDGGANKDSEIGHNSMTFIDQNDNIICSVVFEDNNPSLQRSDMVIYIGNKRIWDTRETTRFYVTGRGDNGPAVVAEKIGNQVTVYFTFAGIKKTFFVDNPNAELRKITWYGATFGSNTPITNNLLRAVQVRKHNVQRYRDVPNFLGSGDVMELDGAKNELYINDIKNWDRVDIGSQPLLLPPGQHTLGITKSSWAQMPEVEVTYTERWL